MNKDQSEPLHYRMSGKGRPVVFLHGFLESLTMWDYLSLDMLERSYILIDLPGHGDSPLSGDAEPTVAHYAKRVHALLKEHAVAEYDVVGHSMGGYVALELLRLDPQPGKVVLLNSNFWTDPEEKKKDRVRVADIVLRAKTLFLRESIPNLFGNPEKHRSEIDALIAEAEQRDAEGYAYASLAMRNRRDSTDLLKTIPGRVLVIQGANDAIIPMKLMQQKCAGWLPVTTLSETGHMAHIEQPLGVMEALRDFLK